MEFGYVWLPLWLAGEQQGILQCRANCDDGLRDWTRPHFHCNAETFHRRSCHNQLRLERRNWRLARPEGKHRNANKNYEYNNQHFRRIPTGRITQPASGSTIAANSVSYQSTDWKSTRATACGRWMQEYRDPSKISKLRAHPKSSSTIWIQIRSWEGSCLTLIWLSSSRFGARAAKIKYLYRIITDCVFFPFFVFLPIQSTHSEPCNFAAPSRIDFPKEVIRKESLFTNIIVDETTSRPENHCNDVTVYISDTVEPGN